MFMILKHLLIYLIHDTLFSICFTWYPLLGALLPHPIVWLSSKTLFLYIHIIPQTGMTPVAEVIQAPPYITFSVLYVLMHWCRFNSIVYRGLRHVEVITSHRYMCNGITHGCHDPNSGLANEMDKSMHAIVQFENIVITLHYLILLSSGDPFTDMD